MRNLTIKREKTFVGCLGKMKVYIEDALANELEINGVPCRKLGDLKNGEEKTFFIGEEAARVYVIADTLSKNYCNEFYPLPAGTEDVFLSGKNHYSPSAGNPFRFHGVTDEVVLENRKKGKKTGRVIFITAIIIGVMIGFGISFGSRMVAQSAPKTFSENGMQITLTGAFDEAEIDGYTCSFSSNKVAVFMLKESFADYPEISTLTLEEYAELLIEVNEIDADLKKTDGLLWFEYDYVNPQNQKEYRYYSVALKGNNAFWFVQFACLEKNFDDLRPKLVEWAKSIELN